MKGLILIRMKANKIFVTLLTLALLFSMLALPVMAEQGIKVVLNGTELSFEVPPQIIGGRTMVPMRRIFEALGAEIEWAGDSQTITAVKNDIVIIMQINNNAMKVNGREITLDVPPQVVNDRTLVPVRAVAEGLNAEVTWDVETQTVRITTDRQSDQKNVILGDWEGYSEDGERVIIRFFPDNTAIIIFDDYRDLDAVFAEISYRDEKLILQLIYHEKEAIGKFNSAEGTLELTFPYWEEQVTVGKTLLTDAAFLGRWIYDFYYDSYVDFYENGVWRIGEYDGFDESYGTGRFVYDASSKTIVIYDEYDEGEVYRVEIIGDYMIVIYDDFYIGVFHKGA